MTFDTEITEFDNLNPEELHLVPAGANGFAPLLAKSAVEDELAKSLCGLDGCEVCAEKAKLKAKQRNALPDSDFAIPDKRAYPIQDEAHARNALARVSQFGTPAEQKQVRAAVHRRYPDIGEDDDATKAAPSQAETQAQCEDADSTDEALTQTRAHPVDGAPVDRDTSAGRGHVPSVPAGTERSTNLHAQHGDTAPDKALPTGEAGSQTRAVQKKGKPVSMKNPSPGSAGWESKDVQLAHDAQEHLRAALEAVNQFAARESTEASEASKATTDAINRATTLISGLVDGTTQTASKEVSDMTKDDLLALLEERENARKELKKAKAERKAAKAAKRAKVEKGAKAPKSTTADDPAEVIKALQARIDALEAQPAGHRPAINGLADPSVRAVKRGEAGNPFEALEKAVVDAATPKERRERQDELTKAKVLANAHIHQQAFPGRPVPLISQPADAYANAFAALGRR